MIMRLKKAKNYDTVPIKCGSTIKSVKFHLKAYLKLFFDSVPTRDGQK